MKTAPYGTWVSPLSAENIAAGSLRLGAVQLDGDDIYWLEGRPQEGGRYALLRWRPDGSIVEVTPPDFNVRSRVHEYGGGAYTVREGMAYWVNFADQRIYRIAPGKAPEPLTPAGAWRYADFDVDVRRGRLICVREDHTQERREPVNTIVSIRIGPDVGRTLSGSPGGPDKARPTRQDFDLSAGDVIASGYDF